MSRPIVIVDPVDSGSELAPAFAAQGISVVAVRSLPAAMWGNIGFAAKLQTAHFQEIHESQPGLEEILRRLYPRAVIAGMESGVLLADRLAAALTPQFANRPELSKARRHKALMQEALAKAGLPTIRTLNTASADEVAAWLAEQDLTRAALVVKPAASAGSDCVYHVPPGGDWRTPFHHILATPTRLLGEPNETVIVQEQVVGTEYAVDTVSADGQHVLAHLIRYSKTSAGERMTVFDHTEFVRFDPAMHGGMIDYAKKALDALGIRWGAAHSEIMLTPEGPRLIECGARMCGGPVLGFARAATGSSQLERVVQAYVSGEITTRDFSFRQTVVPIFLKAPISGVLRNIEVLESLRSLPTHLSTYAWRTNGDHVQRTVDFDTAIGVVTLAGARAAVFSDYERVREAEARLLIEC